MHGTARPTLSPSLRSFQGILLSRLGCRVCLSRSGLVIYLQNGERAKQGKMRWTNAARDGMSERRQMTMVVVVVETGDCHMFPADQQFPFIPHSLLMQTVYALTIRRLTR